MTDRMNDPIREVMTRNVVSVPEELSVESLEQLLLERDLSGVPVVDENRRVVGFAAMHDLVRELHERGDSDDDGEEWVWGYHVDSAPRTVRQMMTKVICELPASCPLASAIRIMATQHVHRAVVVSESSALVGILTSGDIVRYLASNTEREESDHLTEADRLVSLGFLASGVAHQANNALTPMRLSLGRLASFELSRRPLTAEHLHRIELLQDVRQGIARIERIIHELKAFSHADDSSPRSVDVSSQLEIALGIVGHEIRHRARLVCNYAPLPAVRARPADLRQVFVSLLINAAQAIREGEAHVNEIRVTTWTNDRGHAVIEISDTGAGIAPEALSRIFEPFFTTRPPGSGLGLGLSVTRDIVYALEGQIAVESEPGAGTTVRVDLPPSSELATAKPSAKPEPVQSVSERRLRVLIVDDDRPVGAAIALELEPHDVVVAESGREALEILKSDKSFDVILCDLMMPDVSGIEVYDALRLIEPALVQRIVMMTGGAFTARGRQFLSEVDVPLIEKPFEPGQLRRLIRAYDRQGDDLPRPGLPHRSTTPHYRNEEKPS